MKGGFMAWVETGNFWGQNQGKSFEEMESPNIIPSERVMCSTQTVGLENPPTTFEVKNYDPTQTVTAVVELVACGFPISDPL